MSFRGFLFRLSHSCVLADILSETIFNLIVIDEWLFLLFYFFNFSIKNRIMQQIGQALSDLL